MTTALPDIASDTASEKRTWPVRFGERKTRIASVAAIAVAAIAAGAGSTHRSAVTPMLVSAPAVIALALHGPSLFRGPAMNRSSCTRFVATNGLAITLLWISWSGALLLDSFRPF